MLPQPAYWRSQAPVQCRTGTIAAVAELGMPATVAAVAGSFGAAALLLVFLWGAAGWACDVGAALHVALPFDSGHAHNSEQHAGLEGSLAQGTIVLHVQSCMPALGSWQGFRSRSFLMHSERTAAPTAAQICSSDASLRLVSCYGVHLTSLLACGLQEALKASLHLLALSGLTPPPTRWRSSKPFLHQ